MKAKLKVESFRLPVSRRKRAPRRTFSLQPSTFNLPSGFTLIELLVVISILGILAALSVPALKNLGKSNSSVSASRQMLDDVARARQLAIGQHTTVYMLFVPANFWSYQSAAVNALSATTNLCDKQLTGYTFVSLRSVGDQPGQGVPRYLAEWQSLPDGSFIASNKFYTAYSVIKDSSSGTTYPIYQFNYTNSLPFPLETIFNSSTLTLPFIAFNYLGQLTVDGVNLALRDEYIPLAQGNPAYAQDVKTKAFQLAAATFTENPPGNSTNSMFNIIHIDRLTGRSQLLKQNVQ